ncbi:hypothetical protein EYF80_007989 [Liparis tanakae]|uniref:Uncharacterized protein n=1 Tax=Liparis tanakae TaxID=230148 RepID=A0A4Z2IV52_9TELE|nr:hypothetical protein EYF80_007989 [Liparis tanakae]
MAMAAVKARLSHSDTSSPSIFSLKHFTLTDRAWRLLTRLPEEIVQTVHQPLLSHLPFSYPSCPSSSSQLDVIWPVNGTLLCSFLRAPREQMPRAAAAPVPARGGPVSGSGGSGPAAHDCGLDGGIAHGQLGFELLTPAFPGSTAWWPARVNQQQEAVFQ